MGSEDIKARRSSICFRYYGSLRLSAICFTDLTALLKASFISGVILCLAFAFVLPLVEIAVYPALF